MHLFSGISLCRSVLLVLRCREEEKVEEVHVLHQHHAQLVQQNDQSLGNVRREDLALATAEDLEEGSQERFMYQQLVAGMADQQLV